MQLLIFCTLILNVFLDARLIAMPPDRADEVSGAPEVSTPQLFPDFRAGSKDFSGRDTFDDLHESLWAVERH